MKKIIQVLFIIILTFLLSVAISYSFIELSEGETDRGVPVEMSYSGGAAWGDDKWFPDMSGNVAVYCAQHGGTFFKYEQPNVNINVFLSGEGYSGNSQSFQLPKSSTLNEEFTVWSGDVGHGPPDVKLITMMATAYSGFNKGTITAACGPKVAVGDGSATIFTTGITKFAASGSGGGPNTKMAYILAETSRNVGAPASSYVQYAFWAAQGGGGSVGSASAVTSAEASVIVGETSNNTTEDNTISNNTTTDNTASGNNTTPSEITLSESTTTSIPAEIFNSPGDLGDDPPDPNAHGGASSLYQEACDFKAMIDEMGGSYESTISSLTDPNKIKVEFDADKNIYTIGPFAVQYLERYSGSVQLAGMYGVPVLTVRENGQNITMDCQESLAPRQKGWTISKTAEGNGGGSGYGFYPSSGEEFYIKLGYQEGFEKIVNIQFHFRYLQAEGTYTRYTGNIEKVEWKAELEVKSEKCTAHSLCTWGSAHDSPETHDYDDDDEPIKCSGGYHCTHASDGFESYTDHMKYTEVKCKVTANPSGTIDIQDAATCASAKRWYEGLSYDFNFDIDITTSLAGNVWLDIAPQKDNNKVDGLMDEEGLNNIPVTVYLYSGTTRLKEAIMHDADGNKLSWPIKTGDFKKNGYYEAVRIEAPATNENNRCFYVAEFKYDGQVYKHTIFAGDPGNILTAGGNVATKEGTGAEYINDVRMNGNNYKYKNSSCAVEDVNERYYFDQKFGEIAGKGEIANDLSTQGIAHTTNENGIRTGVSNDISYIGQGVGTQIKSTLVSPATGKETNPDTITSGNLYEISAKTFYSEETDTHGSGININNYRIEYPIRESDTNWKWQLNKYKGTSPSGANINYIGEYMLNINLGLIEREHSDMSLLKDLYKVTLVVNEQKLTKQYNYLKDAGTDYATSYTLLEGIRNTAGKQYYSLGLYDNDVTYQSYQRYKNAIDQVVDIKNGTELKAYVTYVIRVYNNSATHLTELNEIADYFDPTYTLVEADVSKSIVDEKLHRNTEIVANAPYYRVLSTSSGMNLWKETKEQNLSAAGIISKGDFSWASKGQSTEYKETRTEAFSTTKLYPNQYIEMFTTYEIDAEGYLQMQQEQAKTQSTDDLRNNRNRLFGEKHNVAEITSYTTYYNAKNATTAERALISAPDYYYKWYMGNNAVNGYGWVSGRIDRDSAPDNIQKNDFLNREKYEDDTDQAIPLRVQIETVVREMTGTVWEEKKNKDLEKYGIKTGDGLYKPEDEEKGIPNVEVSMYEVINLGKFNTPENYNMEYDSYDYYYRVPSVFYGGPVLTESNGTYKLDSFLAGDYVIRFDYGKHKDQSYDFVKQTELESGELNIYKYNGQDYENTKFLTGHEGALNDKYLDITYDRGNISVARDNESRRMVVNAYSRTIENDRGEILRDRNSEEFRDATRMFAETPVLQVEIRDPKELEQETMRHEYNEKYEPLFSAASIGKVYSIPNINFGLEQRAQTDMEIKEYITSVTLTKAEKPIFNVKLDDDGNVIVTADETAELSKLTYVPHTKATDEAKKLYQQGFYAIAVEDNYMNGMELSIDYKIVTTNKSETDFTGKLANYYVPKEIIKLANKTPSSIEERSINELNINRNI